MRRTVRIAFSVFCLSYESNAAYNVNFFFLAKLSDFLGNKYRPLIRSNSSGYPVQGYIFSKKVYNRFSRCAICYFRRWRIGLRPRMYFFVPKLKVEGRQSQTQFLGLVLRPMGAFRGFLVLSKVPNFYLLLGIQYSSLNELDFLDKFSATRCRELPDFSLRVGCGVLRVVYVTLSSLGMLVLQVSRRSKDIPRSHVSY